MHLKSVSFKAVAMFFVALVVTMFLGGACTTEDSVVGQQEQDITEYQVIPIAERLMEKDPSLVDTLPKVDTRECCDDTKSVSPESITMDHEPSDQEVKDIMFNAYDPNKPTSASGRVCFKLGNIPVKSLFSNQCCFAAACCRFSWVLDSFPPKPIVDCVYGQVGCIVNSDCSR